jgi:hypothetical protein
MRRLSWIFIAAGLLAVGFPAIGQEPEPAQGWILQEQELVPGGYYEFTFDYNEVERMQISRGDSKETGYKFAIALPPDFDPGKPQRVLIVSAAGNNAGETTGGDCAVFGAYASACIESGWICLATDSNLGNAGREDLSLLTTLKVLEGLWPGVKGWTYAVGGFSGGGKGCFEPCAILIKAKIQVIGAFLAGVNENRSEKYRKKYKAPASGYRKIRVFLSTGKEDQTATVSQSKGVQDSFKSSGIRDTRMEIFDGGHEIHAPHVGEALKWFAEPGAR